MKVIVPGKFVPERRYVVDILLGEFLGLDYMVEVVPEACDCQIVLPNGNRLVVKDHFFGAFDDGLGYLDAANVPGAVTFVRNDFFPEDDLPVIYGDGRFEVIESGGVRTIVWGADIFASAFFMLTRWEERVVTVRDNHGRFPASEALAVKRGFLHRPIVNEYADALWTMLRHLGLSQERKAHEFSIMPTHDVDTPFFAEPLPRIWRTLDLMITNRRYKAAGKQLSLQALVKSGLRKDPFDNFDFLMGISERFGLRSHFFFMGGGTDADHDGRYSIHDRAVRKLVQHVYSRGHGVGFHPSYSSHGDVAQWERELGELRSMAPCAIISGRQHYLRFSVPETWQTWDDHGLEWDSTCNYAEQAGFRCGVCDSFPVFNVLARKRLALRELPLVFMEQNLLAYQGVTDSCRIMAAVLSLANTVKRRRGVFTLLWHNSAFGARGRQVKDLYGEIIKRISE